MPTHSSFEFFLLYLEVLSLHLPANFVIQLNSSFISIKNVASSAPKKISYITHVLNVRSGMHRLLWFRLFLVPLNFV